MKLLLAMLALLAALPAAAQVPQPPEVAARSYVLVDITSGQDLARSNADAQVEPASLTKLMTAYVVFQALREKRLDLQQEITVSERAWRTGMKESSRMFIEVASKVKVDDLLKGMIVVSGNDAAVALAEAVAGTVEEFVARMNRQAQAWGLKGTTFKNPEGLPASGHVSTAADLAVIAGHLVRDFPEYLPYYSMKELKYNIKKPQQNRNQLLWRDPTVDGLKTGYTEAAGYCLVGTAKRDFPNGQRRVLSVLLGAASSEARTAESQKLLNWGFTAFDDVKFFDAGQAMATPAVWKGSQPTARIGSPTMVMVAVPRGSAGQLRTELQRTDPLVAPLKAGQRVGTLRVIAGTRTVAEVPVVMLEAVSSAGFLQRTWDGVRLLFK
ncbi:MAG TPA: D-alanyl-D-alanine carboxypeptidase family protein [Burkholderiaceae bacterium]|nr:D-alanyl-D-alanine carboxypeptidase family protein [Burkholderiaceae bacterium]